MQIELKPRSVTIAFAVAYARGRSLLRALLSNFLNLFPAHLHYLGACLVLAALAFHQQVQLLPSWWFAVLCAGLIALSVVIRVFVMSRFCARLSERFRQRLRVFSTFLFVLACCCLAWFLWSSQAQDRLNDRLSAQWEGREIQVTGLISSMPLQRQFAQRFEFLIDQAQAGNDELKLPRKIVLSWNPNFSTSVAPPKLAVQYLAPGQLWTFTVKLKRPVSGVNFEGFDGELNAFHKEIGAYGSVYKDRAQFVCGLLCAQVWQSSLRWAIPQIALERLRLLVSHALDELAPMTGERAIGVVKALAIGEQSAISAADWRLFNQTGVSHLMSISGMHVTMTAAMAGWWAVFVWNRLAARLSLPSLVRLPNRRRCAWVSAIVVAFLYCGLAGWGIPAQRTLFTVILIGLLAQQTSGMRALWILQVVALCILLLDPWAVLTIGFWLSFLAVAALMMQGSSTEQNIVDTVNRQPIAGSAVIERTPAQIMVEHFFRHTLVQAVRAQWACTWILIPALAYFFGSVSVVSVAANALAIPVVGLIVTPLALVCAGLSVAVPEFLQPVAGLLVQLISVILNGLFMFLKYLEHSSLAQWVVGQPSIGVVVISTLLILLALTRSWLPFVRPQRWLYIAKFGLLLIGLVPLLLPLLKDSFHYSLPDAKQQPWTLTFFDVGQGSAALINAGGKTILFDVGPQTSADQDAGANIIVPTLRLMGVQKIDLLVLSHLDTAHIGGLSSILDAFSVAKILSGLPNQSVASQRIAGHAAPSQSLSGEAVQSQSESSQAVQSEPTLGQRSQNQAIAVEPCQRGLALTVGGIKLEVLHPSESQSESIQAAKNPNANSCVVMLNDGLNKVLLSSDIQTKQERLLVQRYANDLKADVLAMPGQGAASGSSREFVQAVRPRFAVAQVGYRNRWGAPNKVQERYRQVGEGAQTVEVLRTDYHGALRFRFADQGIEVEQARQKRDAYWRIKP